jgi:hypothetical protein
MAKKPQEKTLISRSITAAFLSLLALGCAYLAILAFRGHDDFMGTVFGIGSLYPAAYAIQTFRGKVGNSTFRRRY